MVLHKIQVMDKENMYNPTERGGSSARANLEWNVAEPERGCLSCQHHSRLAAGRSPFLDGDKFSGGECHDIPILGQLLTELLLLYLPHCRLFLFPFKIVMSFMSIFMAAKQEHVVILWVLCLKKGGPNPSSSGT